MVRNAYDKGAWSDGEDAIIGRMCADGATLSEIVRALPTNRARYDVALRVKELGFSARHGRPAWTDEEDAALYENYPAHGISWDGWERLLPRRSRQSISVRAVNLGIRCEKGRARWTDEEDALLHEHYPEHGPRWDGWAELLPKRSRQAIQQRSARIGASCRPDSFSKDEKKALAGAVADAASELGRDVPSCVRELSRMLATGELRRTARRR